VTSTANDDDKYTLEYFPHGGRDGDDEPPFKYRTFYLDDALGEAWRIARGGGSALSITRQGESALDEDALKKLLEKMSALEGQQSGRGERELAVLALGESGKADTEAGAAEEESGKTAPEGEEIESPS
jgi:hypothetical protein